MNEKFIKMWIDDIRIRGKGGVPVKIVFTFLWWNLFKRHRMIYFMLHTLSGMSISASFTKTKKDSYIYVIETIVLNKEKWLN